MQRSALVFFVLTLGALFQEWPAAAEEGFAVVQTVRGNQLHLFAPVSVNGSKIMWFGVDTGCPISLISPALRHRLSLPTANFQEVDRRSSKTPVVFAKSVKSMGMELGPGYFFQVPIALSIRSESAIHSRIPFDKEGLLGMNFLLKHGAVINCRTQQIFFSRHGAKLPLPRQGYEKMGFTYIPIRITPGGYVEAQGTAADSTYSFIIDTGAFWTILEPAILKRTHAKSYYAGRRVIGPYSGVRDEPLMFGKVPGLKLETQDESNLLLGFAETGNHNFGLTHEYGGLIGADLLFKRHAIIDLGNRGLYLMVDRK
jgi:hypothetical protein